MKRRKRSGRITEQPQQQQQQQQEEQEQQHPQQQQQHDVQSLLAMVLGSLDTKEENAAACALHRTSRSSRGTTIATRKHLSLSRYIMGCSSAGSNIMYMGPDPVPPAAVRAAAAPLHPWQLLADVAAAVALTSLQISGLQARYLLASGPAAAAATAAAAAAGAALSAAQGTTAPAEAATAAATAAAAATTAASATTAAAGATAGTAVPGLAATLAGLRCLKVENILEEGAQLQQVGWLVSACSGLTQLVLETVDDVGSLSIAPFLEGLQAARQQATAAAAAAAVGAQPPAATGAAAAAAAAPCQLPHLQVLEVAGPWTGPLPPWVGHLEAPQLTTLHLERVPLRGGGLRSLAACSGLKELVLTRCVEAPGAAEGDEDLCLPFFELTDHLAALTKLAVQGCPLEDMLDPGVCMLTQLRHLYLAGSWDLEELPSEVSSLRHLTLLDVSDTRLQELPAELGTWMPQLEVLVIAHSRMSVLPDHLDRLTSLDAESCPIHSLAAVEHLTGLKELQLFDAILNPPWEAISKLARLETLVLSLVEGGAAVSPSSLPFLRKLSLSAQDPFQVAAQLVGCGEHLTRLMLVGVLRPEEQLVPDFGQLGVLPVLQELVVCGFGLPRLVAASTWLQQQPRLTWLRLDQQGHVGEPAAWALPPQLQELQLFGSVIPSELPASLAQLTGLSQLCLCKAHFNQLPGWLSRLTRLENLKVSSIMGQFYGWQVLAELPLLRRLEGSSNVPIVMAPLLRRAPHLCWAQE